MPSVSKQITPGTSGDSAISMRLKTSKGVIEVQCPQEEEAMDHYPRMAHALLAWSFVATPLDVPEDTRLKALDSACAL